MLNINPENYMRYHRKNTLKLTAKNGQGADEISLLIFRNKIQQDHNRNLMLNINHINHTTHG